MVRMGTHLSIAKSTIFHLRKCLNSPFEEELATSHLSSAFRGSRSCLAVVPQPLSRPPRQPARRSTGRRRSRRGSCSVSSRVEVAKPGRPSRETRETANESASVGPARALTVKMAGEKKGAASTLFPVRRTPCGTPTSAASPTAIRARPRRLRAGSVPRRSPPGPRRRRRRLSPFLSPLPSLGGGTSPLLHRQHLVPSVPAAVL